MLMFLALAAAGLVLLVGGSLFGHDHDVDHDHDAHVDHGHDAEHGDQPTVSIFSVKVIGTFIMGFGAGGAIAASSGARALVASFVGLATGVALALAMYAVLKLIYSQQANSLVTASSTKGSIGTVSLGISKDAVGEVIVANRRYLARSATGTVIDRGTTVRVTDTAGSELIVTPSVN